MPVNIEAAVPSKLADADLRPRGPVHPSPIDWRDQILYFLLPDRFSDEAPAPPRPLFDRSNPALHAAGSKSAWMNAGKNFQGGTIKGIRSRLGYLKNLGVTALWIGPVFRQRPDLQTYHGYGIQDFLDIDPRFGTRQDLRDLVDDAHSRQMFILLDIIYNHSGNNWFYADAAGNPASDLGYRFAPPYGLHRWRSAAGLPIQAIAARGDGVWPEEFQNDQWYTRAGRIGNWDPQPWEDRLDPRNEFRRGDFFDLKDLRIQEQSPFTRDPLAETVLAALIKVYRYWIALTDCDGFRVDTVKHVSFEASRNFCGAIHEYAESIGKENFLILGEVAGGAELTRSYLDIFGRNLDAALDLGPPMDHLSNLAKGQGDPRTFFAQFGGHDAIGSHREVGRYHVSILDDHDMIDRNPKRRFSASNSAHTRYLKAAHAFGIQLTTLGIPCIYYGTEQAFDGHEGYHDPNVEPLGSDGKIPFRDRYIRESMFGGTFGAFGTEGCHFFDPSHPTYLRIAAIARIMSRKDRIALALRRGRQYPRDVRFGSQGFLPPQAGELVAWSRILFDREVVIAINTHGLANRGGDVTVDSSLHADGDTLDVLYRSDWSDAQLATPPAGQTLTVHVVDDGRAAIRIDLPPAGMIILA